MPSRCSHWTRSWISWRRNGSDRSSEAGSIRVSGPEYGRTPPELPDRGTTRAAYAREFGIRTPRDRSTPVLPRLSPWRPKDRPTARRKAAQSPPAHLPRRPRRYRRCGSWPNPAGTIAWPHARWSPGTRHPVRARTRRSEQPAHPRRRSRTGFIRRGQEDAGGGSISTGRRGPGMIRGYSGSPAWLACSASTARFLARVALDCASP